MAHRILVWHVGDVVQKCRQAWKLSRVELARRSGIHADTIYRLETGKDYKMETLRKLATVFGTTAERLQRDVPLVTDLEQALKTFADADVAPAVENEPTRRAS